MAAVGKLAAVVVENSIVQEEHLATSPYQWQGSTCRTR